MSSFTLALRSLRPRRTLLTVLAAAGLVLTLAACGDDGDSDAGTGDEAAGESEAPGESGPADATLEVDAIAYEDVTVPAGGTLEVVNSSGVGHTFTADDNSFDESYGSDETITVDVPDEPGEYPFHCNIHPSMTGTLTVE